MHFKQRAVLSSKSRIQKNSRYFLSPHGATNPLEELLASIDTFENPKGFIEKYKRHPKCVFPARYRILKRDLEVQTEEINCVDYTTWRRGIGADEIHLVYAAQYASNPASIMGHTFLKFHNNKQEDFLNLSFGYAADVDDKVGALEYAYKGLFGGFTGIFPEHPFYERIHEYNNMERRSLWEYTIDLTSEQKELFLEHLWELKNSANINYFFLDENCSFQIVAVLQVVFPDQNLFDYPIYTLPHETVKKLYRAGFLKNEIYRPSIHTKMTFKFETLNSEQKKNVLQSIEHLSDSTITTWEESEFLLEYLFLQRQYSENKLPSDMDDFEKKILIKRASFGKQERPPIPIPDSPLATHDPMHFEMGEGYNNDDFSFTTLKFRIGVHEMKDKDAGFTKNSTFSFLGIEGKYFHEKSFIKITNIDFISLNNIAPFTRLEPAKSVKFKFYLQEDQGSFCSDCTILNLDPALGLNFELTRNLDILTFLDLNWQFHEDFQNNQRIWPGTSLEFVYRFHSKLKLIQSNRFSVEVLEKNSLRKLSSEIQFMIYDITSNLNLSNEFKVNYFFNKQETFSEYNLKLIYSFY